MMKKTLPVVLETIDIHAGLPRLNSASRATMPDGYVNIAHVRAIEAIVGKYLKMLILSIQLEDTRTLCTAQLYCLSGDDLEHAVQFQGGSDDGGHAVNGGEFMHFAPELFIGLFVESPIFAVDGDDTSNHFDEIHFFGGKIARFESLHADDADESLDIAQKDDRQDNETAVFRAIGTSFGGKMRVGNSVTHQ